MNFIKEVLPGKLAEKQVKRFFELYMNKPPKGKEKDDNFRTLSIKAFSFNYEKYWKNQMEVANVLSEKALKERYLSVKNYLIDFDVCCNRCRLTTVHSRRLWKVSKTTRNP